MNKPLADNLLKAPEMMIALRDFLREWFPKANVRRIPYTIHSGTYGEKNVSVQKTFAVCAETGGIMGYNSIFPVPPPMTLRAVYKLAQQIRTDWEERLKNA